MGVASIRIGLLCFSTSKLVSGPGGVKPQFGGALTPMSTNKKSRRRRNIRKTRTHRTSPFRTLIWELLDAFGILLFLFKIWIILDGEAPTTPFLEVSYLILMRTYTYARKRSRNGKR